MTCSFLIGGPLSALYDMKPLTFNLLCNWREGLEMGMGKLQKGKSRCFGDSHERIHSQAGIAFPRRTYLSYHLPPRLIHSA